ncbi:MAG: nucleotide exchange factor GrpE [Candidatus Portnoybacteria bacterium]|nr:nucleotide exchange factor GrpE [Candidatus Portnoybacteria bacterium]
MEDKNIERDEKEAASEEEIIYESEDSVKLGGDIEKLRKKLKECREEKEKYLAGWQRAQADFINYKRRQEEQQGEWSRMLGEGLIKDILPVLDSLESGIRNQESGIANKDLGLIRKQLLDILRKYGLEEIKSVGEKFNPEWHEVVEYEENDESHESEIVSAEIQKGYLLNGKVLRAAKVRVTK